MDLLTAIQALTKAVEENTAALLAARSGAAQAPAPAAQAPAPAAQAPAPAVQAPAPAAQAPAPAAQAPAPAALTYDSDVKPLAVKVATKRGRDALVSLLDRFGVSKASALEPSDFAPFIEAATRLLEG